MKTILTNVVLFRVVPVLVAASFFLGCGAPFAPAETCTYQGITIQVEAQWQTGKALASCDYFQGVAQDALALDAKFIPADDLKKITDGLTVWVHQDNHTIICSGEMGGAGCNYDIHHIETTSNMGPLAHEILHSYDRLTGNYHSDSALDQHLNWNTQGAQPGAASYIDSTTPFGSNLQIDDGSWWDAAMQLFRHEQSVFIETYCPNQGNC